MASNAQVKAFLWLSGCGEGIVVIETEKLESSPELQLSIGRIRDHLYRRLLNLQIKASDDQE